MWLFWGLGRWRSGAVCVGEAILGLCVLLCWEAMFGVFCRIWEALVCGGSTKYHGSTNYYVRAAGSMRVIRSLQPHHKKWRWWHVE